jgi:tetratricopeptide (TPR) repeat protein
MKKLILVILIGLLAQEVAKAQNDPPPPLGMQPVQVWSVFTENYRNNMFEAALPFGKWLITYRPKTLEGFEAQYRGDRNFQRMIAIYNHLGERNPDPIIKEAYADSALQLYNTVLDIFTDDEIDKFRWQFDRARFIQTNTDKIEDGRARAVNDYKDLYDQDPVRLVEMADGYYILFIIRELINDGQRDAALEMMEDAENHVSDPLVRTQFDDFRNSLFRSPGERIEWLNSQLVNDPDNLDLKRELFDLYQRTNNQQMVREMAVTLYDANPDFANTMRMADYAISNAEYNQAIRYLNEALQRTDDNKKKAEIHVTISDNYLNQRNLQRAREHVRTAMRLDPQSGNAHLKLAEIYAQAVTDCSGGASLDRQDKAVYWLVVDYLQSARRVDSSVANFVQRQLPVYQNITPNAEEKFYMNWMEGETIRIDGSLKECYSWIAETTTIR